MRAILDLVTESRYTGGSDSDGDDIVSNRLHPTIAGKSIYAGNYLYFLAGGTGGFVDELMPPSPISTAAPQGACCTRSTRKPVI